MFRCGLLGIVLGLIIYSCGGAQSTRITDNSQTGVSAEKESRPLSERDKLLKTAEREWTGRDERERVKNAIAYWHQALSLDPDDVETWNRIARAHLFLVESLCVHNEVLSTGEEKNADVEIERDKAGESPTPNQVSIERVTTGNRLATNLNGCAVLKDEAAEALRLNEQKDLLQKGKQAAEQALALHAPHVLKQIEGNEVSSESPDALRKNNVTALYWHSIVLDERSRIKGYTERIIQKDALTLSMAYCIDKIPRYHYAGPHRYFGTYFARPLFLADRNLKKSKMHFERAIAIAPEFLANRYAFARDYAVIAQDRKTFESQLKSVLEADIESDPSTAPENRIYREKAEILLRLASEYFE